MLKCLMIGNCQQYPLKVLLQSVSGFRNRYEIIDDLGPIHTWSNEQVRNVETKYNEVDIILTQPIYDEKYGLARTFALAAFNEKTKNIPIIGFPNIDFLGLFPFSIRIPVQLENDNVPDGQCGIVFLSYLSGFNIQQTIDYWRNFYSDDSYGDIYRSIYQMALARLESSEKLFFPGVNVTNLFQRRYRDIKLTRNRLHPSNYLCEYIANQILAQLKVNETAKAPSMEFWAHDEMPIAPALRRSLGMVFRENDEYFYVKGILKRLEEYVLHLFSYYVAHRNVVEEGIKINEPKLKTILGIIKRDKECVDLRSLFQW
jgi:hypothetical protein